MFVIYYRPGGNSVMCHFCCKTYKQLAALRRHCKEKHGVLAWRIKESRSFMRLIRKRRILRMYWRSRGRGVVMSSSPSLHFLLLITFSIVGGCLYTVCSNKFGLRNNSMFVQYIAPYIIQNLLEHSLCIYASIQFTDGQINLPSWHLLMCKPK